MQNIVSKNHLLSQYSVLLTIAITVLIQSFTIVWWASSLSTRVTTLEGWIKDNRAMPSMILKLEERFDHLKATIERAMRHIEQEKQKA